MAKTETEMGWRKLSSSPKAKRHYFGAGSKESICGGAMMSSNVPPENVKANDPDNCSKCQKALNEPEGTPVEEKKPVKKTVVDPDAKAPAAKKPAVDTKAAEKAKAEKEKEAAKEKAAKDKAAKEAKVAKEKAAKEAKIAKEKAAKEEKVAKDKAAVEAKKAKEAKAVEDKKEKEKKAADAKKEKEEKIAAMKKAKEDAAALKAKEKEDKKATRSAAIAKKKEARAKELEEKKLQRMPKVITTSFDTVEALAAVAKTLDVAEERPLDAGSDRLTDHRAIWNKSKNRLAAIVSEDYSLVQHKEAVKLIAKGLESLNTPVYGQIKNIEDVITVEVYFPKLHIKDDAKGIDVGGKIINSYNKSKAFKGFMAARRKVCENGMYMRKLIPEVNFYEIHVGDLASEIPTLIKEFFDNLKETTEAIKTLVDQAMGTTIKFSHIDEVETTFASELASPVHARALIRDGHLDKSWSAANKAKLVMTKWEFVNAITAYVSHSTVVESRVDIYSSWAEDILDPEYKIEVIAPEVTKS